MIKVFFYKINWQIKIDINTLQILIYFLPKFDVFFPSRVIFIWGLSLKQSHMRWDKRKQKEEKGNIPD